MQVTKCLIVEDEPLAQQVLKEYISSFPELSLIGCAFTAFEAMTMINAFKPDLLFLDINLPQISGFDLLESIKKHKIRVVITSADESYALRAFDYAVVDFLKKPIQMSRFMITISRLQELFVPSVDNFSVPGLNLSPDLKELHILERNVEKTINVFDIFYIKAEGDYVVLVTGDSKHLISSSMNECEKSMPAPPFFRLHRSYMVNCQHIVEFSDVWVKMKGGQSITITPKYAHNRASLNEFTNVG